MAGTLYYTEGGLVSSPRSLPVALADRLIVRGETDQVTRKLAGTLAFPARIEMLDHYDRQISRLPLS